MHKAISVIQFKIEGKLAMENPEFGMDGRRLLERIDYDTMQVKIGQKQYALLDTIFPTIDPSDPYALTEKEQNVMERLTRAFKNCEKQYLNVKSNGPVFNVVQVILNSFTDGGVSPVSIHLRPSCKSWAYLMLDHVSGNLFPELLHKEGALRSGTNQTHSPRSTIES